MERNDIKQTGNEQTDVAAQVAEAKNNEGAAATEVSLGKFKDVKSLLKAYGNLESEFTRRSKRLRELEGEILKKNEEITRLCASSGQDKISGDDSAAETTATEKKVATENAAADNAVNGVNAAETTATEKLTAENAAKKNEKDVYEILTGGDEDAVPPEENNPTPPAEAKISDGGEKEKQERATSEKAETIDAEKAVKAYLLRVFKNRPIAPPVFGTAVTAPPKKPRTFEEAGRLVKTNLGL
ncbi:MAG: hypothetical protein SOT09_05250 [Candidatus Borkfalkiaceae bacterium]|nr:hypothetical protein [Christensenellaceae bacterium]